MDPQENEKKQLEKLKFLKGCIFFFSRGRTKSLSREKRAEKRGREGQEKEHKRKQREDRANTMAPASWNSTPIPGEIVGACRKHAYRPGRISSFFALILMECFRIFSVILSDSDGHCRFLPVDHFLAFLRESNGRVYGVSSTSKRNRAFMDLFLLCKHHRNIHS